MSILARAMSRVARLQSLLRSWIRRRSREAEMRDELHFHIEQRTEDFVRGGVPPCEAKRRAHAEFGSITAQQSACRDALGLQFIDNLRADVRYVIRGLRRSPTFSLGTIAILAIAIGLNTAVITVINAAFFQGFRSVSRNDRILYIQSRKNGRYSGVSYPDFEDWRAETRSLIGLGTVADLKVILNGRDGVPQRLTITRITPNGFRLLGRKPILGRDFQEADGARGATPVAILTYGFWERNYGKDLAVLGRQLRLKAMPAVTVIGVMPRGFSFPQNQDLWIPLVQTPDLQRRDARDLWFAFGRMADGVARERVQKELSAIGMRLAMAYPETNQDQAPQAATFSEYFIGSKAPLIFGTIWLAVGFVLLVACANVANMTLARAIDRAREISLHLALGAGRWRILRMASLESLTLTGMGALAGWFLARAGIRAYEVLDSPPASNWDYGLLTYSMDYRVLSYFVVISIGAAIFFGLLPALRLASLDPDTVLKSGNRGVTAPARRRLLAGVLVVMQVAVAAALLSGAGVMLRSFVAIATADVGADLNRTVALLLHFPEGKYSSRQTRRALMERLKAQLESIPGIEAVAAGSVPAGGAPAAVPYEASGSAPADERNPPSTIVATSSRDYFRTLGAKLLSGRDFRTTDGNDGPGVAVVNERFATRQWPGQDAVGQRIRLLYKGKPQPWLTVVGVASNIVYDRTRQDLSAVVYLYAGQASQIDDPWVLARTSIPADNLGAALRHEIDAVDPDIVMWLGPFDLATRLATGGIYGDVRSHALLLLIFAATALFLAAAGLYTISAYSVRRRTQELGIRIAVGATGRNILELVMKEGMLEVMLGLGVGLLLSLALNRMLESELIHVSPWDPMVLAAASVALIAGTVAGSFIPARRAIRVDPATALRLD
jgi:putative ABC transport system permease protein